MASALTKPIRQFAGENRLLPNDLLTPNIAVDGQNVDYSRGTVLKRSGFTKSHSKAIIPGGVKIENATNNKAIVIRDQTAMDLAGTFTLEIVIEPITNPEDWTATTYIVVKSTVGIATDGWALYYSVANGEWRFTKIDGGAVARTRVMPGDIDTNTPRAGEKYHLAVKRTAGNVMTIRGTRFRDATVASSGGVGVTGDTLNTRDVYVGATVGVAPGNQLSSFKIDELRIWSDERSTTEIDDAKFRELNAEEIADTNLVGYWKFNDKGGNIAQDFSANRNHGNLYASGPSYVSGLVPQASEDNYAIRGDGYDDSVACGYSSAYSTILASDDEWTIEFWARLEASIAPSGTQTLLSFGNTTGQGALLTVNMTTGGLLEYRYSTAAAASNTLRTLATAYYFQPGVPVHIAIQRARATSIRVFINGVAYDDNTGFTGSAENGPGTAATYGMNFFAINSGGTMSQFGQFTLDEVRVWKVARNRVQIQQWMNREYPDIADTNLVGYWRFNAADFQKDEKGNVVNFTESPADDKPEFTSGAVYPRFPSRALRLIGPVAKPIRTDESNAGKPLFDRELLLATRDAFWSQQGDEVMSIKDLPVPGSDNLYSQTNFNGRLIACNGVGRNWIYDGRTLPSSMTLPDDTDVPTATLTGAGGGWPASPGSGAYLYRFTWYNSNQDIEGPYWGTTASVTVNEAVHDSVAIASVPTSVSGYPEVTHWRLYRLDPSATVYRRLATVALGTTTYSDTGTTITSNTALNTTRLHLTAQNYVAVYANRVFVARGSDISFSDADTFDFASTSIIFVDSDDGDAVTGMIALASGLLIFKHNSMHFLSGDGPTTFSLSKIVSGVGCVSGHTIAASPRGVYFLGHDGVYLWSGGAPQYLSHSNQSVFDDLDHSRSNLAVGAYHPETHQYIVSLDLVTASLAFEETQADSAKPAAAAYDSADLVSLFTHFYKCDATGVDSVGTGGTINDADMDFATSDTDRNVVALSSGEWETTITAQTAVASDFTVGFWRKFTKPNTDSSISPATWFKVGTGPTTGIIDGLTFESEILSSVIFYRTNVILNVYLNDSSGGSGTLIFKQTISPATEWHHIVVKKSGTTYTLYVNGEPIQTAGSSNPAAVFAYLGSAETGGIGGDVIEDVYFDNIFWVRNVALTSAQIAAIYDYERAGPAVSITGGLEPDSEDADVTTLTMVYDEETNTFAKHDKRFSYLAVAEHTSNRNEVLAGFNGFVTRLFEGISDGGAIEGLTAVAYTRTGALTAASGFKITDSSATYPTTGNGFAGCQLVCVPSDTSLETQRRTILYNTATTLLLDMALTDTVTGTYYIAPIELVWESPYFDVGEPGFVQVFQFIQMWLTEAAGGVFTLKHRTNDNEDWITITGNTTADEFLRMELPNNGRRIKLRVEHIGPSTVFEMHSVQLQYDQQELVV